MSDFKGSIAQVNVQFPIETVIEPIAGENYSRAIIFMNVTLATANLAGVLTPAAGMKIELNANNYDAIASGDLLKWLVPFFNSARTSTLAIALYDEDTTVDDGQGGSTTVDATAPIEDVYAAYKYYAYFKLGFAAAADYSDLQVALAQLCLADPLYSMLLVGTSDNNVLTKSSALITALKAVNADARVIYNPDTTINAALAQLGDSLATINPSGTPIGNDVDMHAFGTISASGPLDAEGNRGNLSEVDKAALDDQKIGYNTWVGDGTENVVTEGSMTLKGTVVGAQWVKCYIEYMCKIKAANYITQRNRFRNNEQYQALLLILSDIVKDFTSFGRLADFIITAPVFSQLQNSADAIIVPDAWQASYVDRIRSVTIYGTLYVTQPSK